jgi:Putative lipoprotein LpqV
VVHRLGGMRRYPQRVVLCGALLVLAVAGCSSNEQKPSTPPPTTFTSELPPLPAEPAQPGAIGVSPDGVTTAVDVPADATESQYGQACHAAKVWMDGQQADPKTLVEPYLKVLQAPGFTGPGNFNTPWANLTPAQQAGVVLAVNSAANGDCE